MSRIKFRLERWETTVLFQILYMDETFRGSTEKNNKYRADNDMLIVSSRMPCLEYTEVYLLGDDRTMDRAVPDLTFNTVREADEYCQKLFVALRDWAENWEGWGKKDDTEDDYPNVFKF